MDDRFPFPGEAPRDNRDAVVVERDRAGAAERHRGFGRREAFGGDRGTMGDFFLGGGGGGRFLFTLFFSLTSFPFPKTNSLSCTELLRPRRESQHPDLHAAGHVVQPNPSGEFFLSEVDFFLSLSSLSRHFSFSFFLLLIKPLSLRPHPTPSPNSN